MLFICNYVPEASEERISIELVQSFFLFVKTAYILFSFGHFCKNILFVVGKTQIPTKSWK